MAVRNKRRCRNCPEEVQVTPQTTATKPVLTISTQSEGKRLWSYVLTGTNACIGMMEGYSNIDMPGMPREAIEALVSRLQTILKRTDAASTDLENPGASHERDG